MNGEVPEWYDHLTQDECRAQLLEADERYWNAVEVLGSISTSRQVLQNHLKDLMKLIL